MDNKLLKPKQACQLLNVSLTTLRNWSNDNKIKCIKLDSGHRRYLKDDVNNILKQLEDNYDNE